MEIYILLAGVTLGPYSEDYLRRSLEEGHLHRTDKARTGATGEWSTVEQILTQLSAPTSSPQPTAPPPPPKPAPAPVPSVPLPPLKPTSITPAGSTPAPKIPTPKPTAPPPLTPAPTNPYLSPELRDLTSTTKRVFSPETISESGKTALPPSIPDEKKSTPAKPIRASSAPTAIPAPKPAVTSAEGTPSAPAIPRPKAKESSTPQPVTIPTSVQASAKPAAALPPQKKEKQEAIPKPTPVPISASAPAPIRGPDSTPSPSKFNRVLPVMLFALGGLVLLIAGGLGYYFWSSPSTTKASEDQPQAEAPSTPSSEMPNKPEVSPSPTPTPTPEPSPAPLENVAPPIPPEPNPVPTPNPAAPPSPSPESTGSPESGMPQPAPEAAHETALAPVPAPSPTPIPSPTPTPTPNPASATLYLNQGDAKMAKEDVDGAIADYSHALEINPKLTEASCARGIARQAKDDLDGAIADYTQALQDDPKFVIASRNRGLARQAKGDVDGAIADYTHALSLDTKDTQDYYSRALAKLAQGDTLGGLGDLKEFCHVAPEDTYTHYANLYIWVVSSRLKHTKAVDDDLLMALGGGWNSAADEIASKIAKFLLGQIHEYDLISAATVPDAKQTQGRYCEIWYFAGIKRLMAGNTATASDYFRKCVATGQKNYCEYLLAQAELKKMDAENKNSPSPTPSSKH